MPCHNRFWHSKKCQKFLGLDCTLGKSCHWLFGVGACIPEGEPVMNKLLQALMVILVELLQGKLNSTPVYVVTVMWQPLMFASHVCAVVLHGGSTLEAVLKFADYGLTVDEQVWVTLWDERAGFWFCLSGN